MVGGRRGSTGTSGASAAGSSAAASTGVSSGGGGGGGAITTSGNTTCFVATDGAIRGVKLESAFAHIRQQAPQLQATDTQLAQAILAI